MQHGRDVNVLLRIQRNIMRLLVACPAACDDPDHVTGAIAFHDEDVIAIAGNACPRVPVRERNRPKQLPNVVTVALRVAGDVKEI